MIISLDVPSLSRLLSHHAARHESSTGRCTRLLHPVIRKSSGGFKKARAAKPLKALAKKHITDRLSGSQPETIEGVQRDHLNADDPRADDFAPE